MTTIVPDKDERPFGERTCTAHRSNGDPCKAPAIRGGTVCRAHGGSSPQAQRAARLRLLELVDPAIATLEREMENADKSADRQRAAENILDRTGYGRTQRVDIAQAQEVLVEKLTELRDEARQIIEDTTDQDG